MKEGWEIKKLGEVCELSAGGDVPKDNFSETKTEKYSIPIYANGEKNEGLYGYTNIAKVSKPSITVSARGTIGFSVKRLEAFFPVVRLIVVTPINQKELDLDFLDYSLKRIDFKHSGSSIPQLTVPMIRDYEIPLPPLPEQQRIVAILDQCFAAIDKAKANAEQNLKNAKELFESYLQGVFENKGEGWEEKKLGEVCKTGAGGTPLKTHKEYYEGGTIPWLLSGEVSQGEIFQAKNFITEKGLKNSSAKLFPPNTVLVAMYGATAGQVGILRFESTTNQAVCGILPNENFIAEFLYYKFLAGKELLVSQAVGGAQPNISQIKIKNTLVPIISIKEQQTIVRQLDALRAETQKLEAVYQKKIADLEELKKSILQKAFKGELHGGEPAELETDTSSSSVPVAYEINDNLSKAAEPDSIKDKNLN